MERRRSLNTRRVALAVWAASVLAAVPPLSAQTAGSGAFDRIKQTSRINFGYREDARPFAYRTETGLVDGYAIALCQQIAAVVKQTLGLSVLAVDWVPVTAQDRFRAVQQGTVDLLCDGSTVTLDRRSVVSFSIPIFPGGTGALLRADAPMRLRNVLSGHGQTFTPTWRANASQVLSSRNFAAVTGTSSERFLTERIEDLQVRTAVTQTATYDAGIDALIGRRIDALFGERAILLDAARRHAGGGNFVVIDRLFTNEPLALALQPNDERFRLLVDRALSQFYQSGQLGALYTKWFGEPDGSAITFFKWSALSE